MKNLFTSAENRLTRFVGGANLLENPQPENTDNNPRHQIETTGKPLDTVDSATVEKGDQLPEHDAEDLQKQTEEQVEAMRQEQDGTKNELADMKATVESTRTKKFDQKLTDQHQAKSEGVDEVMEGVDTFVTAGAGELANSETMHTKTGDQFTEEEAKPDTSVETNKVEDAQAKNAENADARGASSEKADTTTTKENQAEEDQEKLVRNDAIEDKGNKAVA